LQSAVKHSIQIVNDTALHLTADVVSHNSLIDHPAVITVCLAPSDIKLDKKSAADYNTTVLSQWVLNTHRCSASQGEEFLTSQVQEAQLLQ